MKKLLLGIMIGSTLTVTTSVFADSIKEYMLTKIDYPIMVKGKEYSNADLPALNYEGYTYVSLKAVGDLLSANVLWNDQLQRVEISDKAVINEQNGSATSVKPSSQVTILKDYLQNAVLPAIKVDNTVFLPLLDGFKKYGLLSAKPIWNPDRNTYDFTGVNAKISIEKEKITSTFDGIVFQGNTYVKEDVLVNISELYEKQKKIQSPTIEGTYDGFKALFTIGQKKLIPQSNIVEMSAIYTGYLKKDVFMKYWSTLQIKKEFMEKLAIEQQIINSHNEVILNFYYEGGYLGNVLVNTDRIATTYIAENPFPDQAP